MVRLNDITMENNRSESKHLELKLIREIPKELKTGAIEDAVSEFITDAMIDAHPQGFYRQTIERVAMATFLNAPGWEFWLAHAEGAVKMYVLANITKDIDNRLCYWINQIWLKEEGRNDAAFAKGIWEQLKEHAKRRHCAHIIIPSIRDGWTRFLKDDIQPYIELLKKDLEE